MNETYNLLLKNIAVRRKLAEKFSDKRELAMLGAQELMIRSEMKKNKDLEDLLHPPKVNSSIVPDGHWRREEAKVVKKRKSKVK